MGSGCDSAQFFHPLELFDVFSSRIEASADGIHGLERMGSDGIIHYRLVARHSDPTYGFLLLVVTYIQRSNGHYKTHEYGQTISIPSEAGEIEAESIETASAADGLTFVLSCRVRSIDGAYSGSALFVVK